MQSPCNLPTSTVSCMFQISILSLKAAFIEMRHLIPAMFDAYPPPPSPGTAWPGLPTLCGDSNLHYCLSDQPVTKRPLEGTYPENSVSLHLLESVQVTQNEWLSYPAATKGA